MIPKIIHYCWYGGKKKSNLIEKCLTSWRTYFPDCEIMEWNEANTDLNENEYIKKAYERKMWAFVSDYVRMKVLYQYGGLYFDTDVEVLKKFPMDLFELSAFSGIEGFSGLVNPGLVFGCESGLKLVGEMVESYQQDKFDDSDFEKMVTINMRITELLKNEGFILEDRKQVVNGFTIFPSSVFCGYDGERRKIVISEESLSVHHYSHSWFPKHRRFRLFLGTVKRRIMYYFGYS